MKKLWLISIAIFLFSFAIVVTVHGGRVQALHVVAIRCHSGSS